MILSSKVVLIDLIELRQWFLGVVFGCLRGKASTCTLLLTINGLSTFIFPMRMALFPSLVLFTTVSFLYLGIFFRKSLMLLLRGSWGLDSQG